MWLILLQLQLNRENAMVMQIVVVRMKFSYTVHNNVAEQ